MQECCIGHGGSVVPACHSSSPGACHWPSARATPSSSGPQLRAEPCATHAARRVPFFEERTPNLTVCGINCLLKSSALAQRPLCRGRALPVSGPSALCVDLWRSLCRAAPLSRRSVCRAPALSVRGPGGLCVGPRRSLCRGPGALCVGSRRTLCRAPALHQMLRLQTCTALQVCFMAIDFRIINVGYLRAKPSSEPRAAHVPPSLVPLSSSAGLCNSAVLSPPAQSRVPPELRAACHPSGPPAPSAIRCAGPQLRLPLSRSAGPQLRAACHPSNPARSLFPGKNPKPYCLGKNGRGTCLRHAMQLKRRSRACQICFTS